jgi:glycosyltransferase involved in cell wall biosynthesis
MAVEPGLVDREPGARAEQAASTARRPRLSGLVTTFNSAARLRACLDSIIWCDDVLVVDSFSTDRTLEIAQSYPNVRVVQRPYYGAASAKNWGVNQLGSEWVFILDSDEVCPPALRAEIETLLRAGPTSQAFFIRRRVFFLGRHIRFSGWRHDRVGRLFRVGSARFTRRRVHPALITDGPAPLLRQPMDHFMADSFDEYVRRIVTYAYWGAAQAYRDGRRAGMWQVTARPFYRFFRTYVLQLGFLDGMYGLVFCALQAVGSYLKWSMLWGWRVTEAQGIAPELPDFDDDATVWQGLPR